MARSWKTRLPLKVMKYSYQLMVRRGLSWPGDFLYFTLFPTGAPPFLRASAWRPLVAVHAAFDHYRSIASMRRNISSHISSDGARAPVPSLSAPLPSDALVRRVPLAQLHQVVRSPDP